MELCPHVTAVAGMASSAIPNEIRVDGFSVEPAGALASVAKPWPSPQLSTAYPLDPVIDPVIDPMTDLMIKPWRRRRATSTCI
jgi:hypothetical protein